MSRSAKALRVGVRSFLVVGLATLLSFSAVLASQEPAPQPATPSFDAASVKAAKRGDDRVSISLNLPGRFSAENVSLEILLTAAYQVSSDRVIGMPEWSNSRHFNVEATSESNPPKEEKRLMLRSLLADRFKLAGHHETRKMKIYALELVKPGTLGPKLHPSSLQCPDESTPPTSSLAVPDASESARSCDNLSLNAYPGKVRLVGIAMKMEQLGTSLDRRGVVAVMGRPVVDRTGLKGNFDFDFEFTPLLSGLSPTQPGASASDEPAPSIIEALKNQLGLKLESQTGDVDVIVIDHVEPPSEN